MKKIVYMAAALLAVAGCAKNELAPEVATKSNTFSVSLKVSDETTKAVFDGDKHIKFEKGDQMYVAIATKEEPLKAIEVVGPTGYGTSMVTSFKIDDNKLEEPVFNGQFKGMEAKYVADEYNLYGVFPSKALYSTSYVEKLTNWTIVLPETQQATQASWDGKADVMVMAPTTVRAQNATPTGDSKTYYNADGSQSVKLAHVFGFGKFTFADVPAEYSDLVVKSVTIKTKDDSPKKYLTGQYVVDVTKDVVNYELAEGRSYNMSQSVILPGDGTTTVADYTAWFVAAPGEYNVVVTVSTKKADFTFERNGLVISSSRISAPTIHYKDADVIKDKAVVLKEGEKWVMSNITYNNALKEKGVGKEWGDDNYAPMIFSITYPGTTNGVNPETLYGDNYKYVQKLAGNLVNGGKIVLASECDFRGMKNIKMELGVYTNDVEADFHVSVDNGTDVVELGKYTIKGSNKSTAGTPCFFKTTEATENGILILTVDNLPKNEAGDYIYVQEYLKSIVINPDPELAVDAAETLKLEKDAATGEFAAKVYVSEDVPTVTVSEDAQSWLTASYADGKVTYSLTENTGSKRTGVITIALGDVKKTVTIVQKSANAVEYKLSVTAADVKAGLAAAKEAGTTFADEDTFIGKFKATSLDGSKMTEVELKFTHLYCNDTMEDVFKMRTDGSETMIVPTTSLGYMEQAVVVASNKTTSNPNNWTDLTMKQSADNNIWNFVKGGTYESKDGYYTNRFTNEDESMVWFSINCGWGVIAFKSFEITYLAE